METPAGATPEESQADAIGEPSAEDQLDEVIEGEPEATSEESQIDDGEEEDDFDTLFSPEELQEILGEEEEPTKPFGNQTISEDEAVEMDRK
jgi:hypothetical protein